MTFNRCSATNKRVDGMMRKCLFISQHASNIENYTHIEFFKISIKLSAIRPFPSIFSAWIFQVLRAMGVPGAIIGFDGQGQLTRSLEAHGFGAVDPY